MRDLMDIFTRSPVDLDASDNVAGSCHVPLDHPRAEQLGDVSLAHSLCMQGGMTNRQAMRACARGLGMSQAQFDVLLAEHRRITGVVPGTRNVAISIMVDPSRTRTAPRG